MLRRQNQGVAMRFIALAVLLVGTAGSSLAAERKPQLLAGQVGVSPIVMELDPSAAGGRYFYRRTRFDINLSGDAKAGSVSIEAEMTGDKFVLRPAGAGWTGEMTTKSGKRLPVTLRALPAGDSYASERRAGLALAPDKSETIDGHPVRWYVEAASHLSLFRLEGGYPPAVTTAINAALERAQWQQVENYFGCPGEEGGPGVEDSRASSVYLSDAYVSWAWSSNWACAQAAHPDFGTEGHTFSARTGRELTLDELLGFAKAPPAESNAWLDYRSSTFAPALVARMKALHPKEMAAPGSDDGCDYSDPGVWDFPTWYLTPKGLYVGAIFARVARNCDDPDWSVIPWSALARR
jgi:hypothetical protein